MPGQVQHAARQLHEAAIAALGPPRRRDGAGHRRGIGAQQHHPATVALSGRVGADHGALLDHEASRGGGGDAAATAVAALGARQRGAQRHRATAGFARGIDPRVRGQHRGVVARYLHRAAGRARRAALGADCAFHHHVAADAADQHPPGLRGGAVGTDMAAGIDKLLHHPIHRGGGQHDAAALRLDHAAIGYQRLVAVRCGRDLLGDVDRHQPVAVQVERVGLGAAQDDGAELGADHARVAHLRRHQGGQSALLDGDGAAVDDPRVRVGGLVEDHLAGHEVAVADARRRDDEAGRVHLRALVEHQARLVHHHQLAVRLDLAGDFRGVRADHAVQRHGARRGLLELHGLLAADIEALPVHCGALAGLVHRRRRRGLADAGLSGHHLPAGGLRIGRRLCCGRTRRQRCRRQRQHGDRMQRRGGAQAISPACTLRKP